MKFLYDSAQYQYSGWPRTLSRGGTDLGITPKTGLVFKWIKVRTKYLQKVGIWCVL